MTGQWKNPMSSRSLPFAGPRRMILIQSAKFDYAELDLTRSFQLVGVNGLGKTALISTLQYLYIDLERSMKFGQHALDDTRRFYFRSDASFILFECETSVGTVTLGIRSLGTTSGYQIQRFAWRGGYVMDEFIGSDSRPKRWDEVRPALGTKGLQILTESADLRRLLGAVDDETVNTWGIVPLAESRDYSRFRQTFQRLLQLRDIRQHDLKELLADCAKLGPGQREIDLAKDFEKELARIERDRLEINRLSAAKPAVEEVRRLFDREYSARSIAHALAREVQQRFADSTSTYKRRLDALVKVRDDLSARHSTLSQEKDRLMEELQAANEKKGLASHALVQLEQARDRFASFVLEIEEQARDVLQHEISSLQSRLADVPTEPLETLTKQLEEKNGERDRLRGVAQHLDELFVTWLRQQLPSDDLNRVAAMFDRRLLESLMDEQVRIRDERLLLQRLTAAASRCDVRGYCDDAIEVEFPSGAIAAAADLGRKDRIEEKIRALEREISRLAANIETLRTSAALKERLKAACKEHEGKIKEIGAYTRFQEKLAQESLLKVEQETWSRKAGSLRDELAKNESARADIVRQGDEVFRKLEELKTEQSGIHEESRNPPIADGDDPGETPISSVAIKELPESLVEAFRVARRKCDDARTLQTQLDSKVSGIDRDFMDASFPYSISAPVDERLKQLESQIASLTERTENIENRWTSVLLDAKRCFHTLLKSLDAVQKEVRKLNGELAEIEFSSIASVRLEVLHDAACVSEYQRHATDATQPSLFDTAPEADRKLSQFRQMLQQRPKLSLQELFSLRCEVCRKDGKRNLYDDFDSVESTGTTIVLKVTLNLLVLRDLLVPGKARIPYYLDEVHALDRQNFRNILQLSERLGFVGIFAAPTAAIGPRRFVHLVPDGHGHLVVTRAHQKDIVRTPEEAEATVDG